MPLDPLRTGVLPELCNDVQTSSERMFPSLLAYCIKMMWKEVLGVWILGFRTLVLGLGATGLHFDENGYSVCPFSSSFILRYRTLCCFSHASSLCQSLYSSPNRRGELSGVSLPERSLGTPPFRLHGGSVHCTKAASD